MTKTMTLEAAVARLEEIATLLGDEISIDDAVKLYGEAVKLLGYSTEKLETARQKIEKLSAAKETEDEAV